MSPSLTPEEQAVVDEAVEELRTEEGPVDRGPLGCLLALPAFLLLLVVPILGRRFELPAQVATPVIIAAIVLLVVGLVLWFTAGGFVRGHVSAAAEAALRGLEAWDPETGEREEALRGATLLVMNAYASYGPSTVQAFALGEARTRLGAMMPLVEAVEEYLVERGVSYRVFTEGEGEEPGGDEAA